MNKLVISFLSLCFYSIFAFDICAQTSEYRLINKNATSKTEALYENLQWYKGKGILFGHEDDLAYGVNWKNEEGRSDVMEVCNDFPAVFGWDISKIGMQSANRDGVNFNMMNQWMQLIYKSSGVNTITWMMDNPVSGGPSEDLTPAIGEILPDGPKHEMYKSRLDQVARFIEELNVGKSENKSIPIIFRPFPIKSNEKLWWSPGIASPSEYKKLWQFTIDYLISKKSIETLIVAFSTDKFNAVEEFNLYYPGDDFVDIIGLNLYDSGDQNFDQVLSKKLLILNQIGMERNKVTAITETGIKQIPLDNWWTDKLMKGIFRDRSTANISYVMVGKNLSSNHFYAPYPEHSSAENFKQLYNNMYTLFLKDIPDVYVAR